jgi:DNA polymerase III subunit gamma/tau
MAGDIASSGSSGGPRAEDRQGIPDAPLALYRRYRPATFAEVKGQDHVTEPLRQALRSGRVHHAYLFSGPRGCGKTSSARILARSLNCEQGPTPDPCGKCASCVALAPSGPGSIDVIEIDAASHGGIDDARDLRERAFYSPVAARYKIYIIDEAHMVTGAGFNALLKLVEEPPPHLKFVFATTEPEKVIPTIKSRTHHYPFRLVPPAILRELLEAILSSEGIGYEPAVLPVVIRAGAGSVRDSLSVLDQLIAGADESGLRYDRAIALLGYTDDALLDEMAEALAARDGAGVFLAIDHVVEAGHDPRRFAMDLLDRLRDLIVLAAVPGAGASGLLDASEDQLDRMRKQAAEFGQDRLATAADTISNGLIEMRGATSPRLLLELMCAQVLLPAAPAYSKSPEGTPGNELAARVERLERQLASGVATNRGLVPGPGGRPAPGPGGGPATAPAVRPATAPGVRPGTGASGPGTGAGGPGTGEAAVRAGSGYGPEGGQSAAGTPADHDSAEAGQAAGSEAPVTLDPDVLQSRWAEVLEAVRDVRKTAWILLSNYASIDAVEGNVLTMAFDTEGNAKGFANSGSDGYLADVLHAMFGVRPVIRAIVNPAGGRGTTRGPARPAGDDYGRAGGRAPQGSGPAGRHDISRHDAGRDAGPASNPAPTGAAQRSSDGPELSGSGDRTRRPGTGRAAGSRSGPADSSGRAADARGQPQSGPQARTTSPTRESRGRASAVSPRRMPAGSDLADDPRPDTADETGDETDELTGTDLVMRELGGRVIEEITDV